MNISTDNNTQIAFMALFINSLSPQGFSTLTTKKYLRLSFLQLNFKAMHNRTKNGVKFNL